MSNAVGWFAGLRVMLFIGLLGTGCGGGSSGTGRDGTNAQILDANCDPLANENLGAYGIPSVQGSSDGDGGFTVAPDAAGSILIETEAGALSVPASSSSCVFIFVEDFSVENILSYPIEAIRECTLDAVRDTFPGDLAAICVARPDRRAGRTSPGGSPIGASDRVR